MVTILLEAVRLTSRDLWHLAYTLHHELICHAFQNASSEQAVNAHASCHWSEGWMDTIAFDLVTEWVDDTTRPVSWLPLTGDDARGELWSFHDRRYSKPLDLAPDDVTRRRRARDAYRRLAQTLSQFGMADEAEAAAIARCFALAANVRSDCRRLKALSSKLRIAPDSVARPTAAIAAATACLAFAKDRDFAKLDLALNSLND